jgi:hypothetical protein
MAVRRLLQSPAILPAVLVGLWFVGVAAVAGCAVDDPVPDLRHPAVTASAGLTVGWMLLAWALMLAAPRQVTAARLAWTLGLLMLLLHLVVAFGVAHGWSHAAAVEHVRQVGGFGAGIAVNYLFAAVWLADVAWWWADPTGRATRPRWVGWAVHGFLAFVVVNAAVIFGPAERQWVYALGLGLLAALSLARAVRLRSAHSPT